MSSIENQHDREERTKNISCKFSGISRWEKFTGYTCKSSKQIIENINYGSKVVTLGGRRQVCMASILKFDTGKAVIQVAAMLPGCLSSGSGTLRGLR